MLARFRRIAPKCMMAHTIRLMAHRCVLRDHAVLHLWEVVRLRTLASVRPPQRTLRQTDASVQPHECLAHCVATQATVQPNPETQPGQHHCAAATCASRQDERCHQRALLEAFALCCMASLCSPNKCFPRRGKSGNKRAQLQALAGAKCQAVLDVRHGLHQGDAHLGRHADAEHPPTRLHRARFGALLPYGKVAGSAAAHSSRQTPQEYLGLLMT